MSNLETVRQLFDAFARGDFPVIIEHLDESVEWEYGVNSTDCPWLQPRRGRKDAEGFFATLGEVVIQNLVVKHLLESGDVVAVVVDLEFTVNSTGRKVVEEDEVLLWHFNPEGKVIRFRHRSDTHQQQMAWSGLSSGSGVPAQPGRTAGNEGKVGNLGTVQQIYAAFGSGDVPAILGHLDESVEWEYGVNSTDVPWLQPRHGREGAGAFFLSLGEVDIHRFDVKNLMEGEGIVAALVDLELTVKATGKKVVEEDEIHLWRFNPEGKVTRFRHRVDTHQHQRAWRE